MTPIAFAYARRMSESQESKGIGRIIAVPAPKSWSEVVFVCAKCMKRQDRRDLRKALKSALKAAGRRDVTQGCFRSLRYGGRSSVNLGYDQARMRGGIVEMNFWGDFRRRPGEGRDP